MKITAVDTIQVAAYSNIVWVEIHTDEGIDGLARTSGLLEFFDEFAGQPRLLHHTFFSLSGLHILTIPTHSPLSDGIPATR